MTEVFARKIARVRPAAAGLRSSKPFHRYVLCKEAPGGVEPPNGGFAVPFTVFSAFLSITARQVDQRFRLSLPRFAWRPVLSVLGFICPALCPTPRKMSDPPAIKSVLRAGKRPAQPTHQHRGVIMSGKMVDVSFDEFLGALRSREERQDQIADAVRSFILKACRQARRFRKPLQADLSFDADGKASDLTIYLVERGGWRQLFIPIQGDIYTQRFRDRRDICSEIPDQGRDAIPVLEGDAA